jgi:hypothetical protein
LKHLNSWCVSSFEFVDQGVLAQRDTTAPKFGAVAVGETHHVLNKRCGLDEVRSFFKDNPTWE